MTRKKTIADVVVQHLRETQNYGISISDVGLCHEVAEKLGWKHDGYNTPRRLINALHKTPGILVKRYSRFGSVKQCSFYVPEALWSVLRK